MEQKIEKEVADIEVSIAMVLSEFPVHKSFTQLIISKIE